MEKGMIFAISHKGGRDPSQHTNIAALVEHPKGRPRSEGVLYQTGFLSLAWRIPTYQAASVS